MHKLKYLLGTLLIFLCALSIMELIIFCVPIGWQVISSILILSLLIILTIIIFFFKSNIILNTCFFLLLIVNYIVFPEFPRINTIIDIDNCIEYDVCKEGLEVYYKNEKILINKDTCMKNNLKWDDKYKKCYMTINSKN